MAEIGSAQLFLLKVAGFGLTQILQLNYHYKWQTCAKQITNWDNYNVNLTCDEPTILRVGLLGCANKITNCHNYNYDLTCASCAQPKILTHGKIGCASEITSSAT